MKLEDWITGIIATALAGIAMGIFMRVTWKGWDLFIEWVMKTFSVGAEIEYVLGLIIFVDACHVHDVTFKKNSTRIFFP